MNVILPELKKIIIGKSIKEVGPRDWKRIQIFARNQAIVTAIEEVCNLPGGKWYGKPFTIDAVVDIEPRLVVTEEMVFFTMSLFADQFRSPYEHKILHAIGNKEEIKKAPTYANPLDGSTSELKKIDYNYLKLPPLQQLVTLVKTSMTLEQGKTSSNNIGSFFHDMTTHSVLSAGYSKPERKRHSLLR